MISPYSVRDPSACCTLNVDHALDLAHLLNQTLQFFFSFDAERYRNRRDPLLAGLGIDPADTDLPFGKDLCDIHKKAFSVMAEDLDLRDIKSLAFSLGILLPFGIDQARTLHVREIDDVDTVGPVYGNTSAPRYKTNDLVPRYRAAAFGKMHCHIIKSLDNDATL